MTTHRTIASASAMALVLAAACARQQEIADEPVPVVVTVLAPTAVSDEVIAAARLEGASEAMVYAGAGGRVEQVLISEGDSVVAGQRLVRLATDRSVSAGSSAAQAAVAAATANEASARRSLERLETLYEAGAVSDQELDSARAMYEAARAALQQARAGAVQAGAMADNSFVQAPFDGRVGRIWVREGGSAGGGPVLSVTNSAALVARLLLPEMALTRLRPGLPAYISVTALGGESFPGIVTAAARSVDPVSGLVPVEVAFENPGGRLMPGMTGRVAVLVETHEGVVALPEYAFRRSAEGFEVARMNGGRVTIVPVLTGIGSEGMVEVVSGLAPGDTVIVQGQFLVADGDPVRIASLEQ